MYNSAVVNRIVATHNTVCILCSCSAATQQYPVNAKVEGGEWEEPVPVIRAQASVVSRAHPLQPFRLLFF